MQTPALSQWFCEAHRLLRVVLVLPGYALAHACGRCREYDSASDSWRRTCAMSTVLLVDDEDAMKDSRGTFTGLSRTD
ncbi:hypothetical protein PQR02_35270 [Paraburkholderia sediminicola]|uniref:Uncharacterized protein n=1 Tax=Paraburkholderia rhynchosiae TaxID=487049 RepID=A0ACC7NLK3_9BURK